MNVDNLRLAKDMKYEALYWALGFEELEKNTFSKKYNNLIVKIKLIIKTKKIERNSIKL